MKALETKTHNLSKEEFDEVTDIISVWWTECKMDTLPYEEISTFHLDGNFLHIQTAHPGLLIGLYGETINRYRKLLEDFNISSIIFDKPDDSKLRELKIQYWEKEHKK